jgi:hypothetical protein
MTPDKTSTMPEHFIVLRHQEGDDWDCVVIQHLGSKAEVTATAPAPSDAVRALTAWHNDTFVSGPSWGVFSKEMSIGGSADSASLVYIVGVHRAVPGHREQLLTSLNAAGPWNKIQTGDVLLQHLEGSEWTGQRIRFEVGVRLDLARCRERASDQHPDRRRRRSAALLAEHGVRAAAGTPSGPRRRVGTMARDSPRLGPIGVFQFR